MSATPTSFTQTSSKSETIIKKDDQHDVIKDLHIVWRGSKMHAEHVKRVGLWESINHKSITVTIWTDNQLIETIKEQFPKQKPISMAGVEGKEGKSKKRKTEKRGKDRSKKTKNKVKIAVDTDVYANVDVKDFETLDIPPSVVELLKKFDDNWGAISDVIRFYILRKHGGCYVDTDVVPFNFRSIFANINPTLKFMFNCTLSEDGKKMQYLNQDVVASCANGILPKMATQLIEFWSQPVYAEMIVPLVTSEIASTRCYGTWHTTGHILEMALNNLLIGDLSILRADFSQLTEGFISSISRPFEARCEFSWLVRSSNAKPRDLRPTSKKVILDTEFVKMKQFGTKHYENPLFFKFEEMTYPLRVAASFGIPKVLAFFSKIEAILSVPEARELESIFTIRHYDSIKTAEYVLNVTPLFSLRSNRSKGVEGAGTKFLTKVDQYNISKYKY